MIDKGGGGGEEWVQKKGGIKSVVRVLALYGFFLNEMIVFTLLFLQQKINFKISDYLYFTVINHKP